MKLVHSPRGMLGLEALRISPGRKRLAWYLGQRAALARADCLHATAESEYREIRDAGLRNPVAIIPNGIDLPALGDAPRPKGADRTVLSLGRIHPKKGLDQLVRAWAIVGREFPWHSLRIVGPAELGYDGELRDLARTLKAERIRIEGPIYAAEEKLTAYRHASVFVLPTRNENFGMTVAESLAAETPVISTKGAPWAGLVSHGCGWSIDFGVQSLVAALRDALLLPDSQLERMGARGRAWMAEDFGWDKIARDMSEVYRWVTSQGTPPSTIRFD